MPHSVAGFYTDTKVSNLTPGTVLDTKNKQPSHLGGENSNNTNTAANDNNKQ